MKHAYPDKFGKYEIIEKVGEGSMGTVFSANDPFTDRKVAIKVAHPQYIDDSEAGQRFRKLFFNEAHAAGMLDHPNILKIFDAGVEGEFCYLVMEYIDGAATLEPYCKPDTLLSVREVVGIMYKVAKALDYAHRQGIIHRDVKPSNILLTNERDIKVADFSIAMVTNKDSTRTQFTGFMGSPLYMSPEQINEGTISSTSDIFALGTVTYVLLTGKNPFNANNLSAINQKITHEDVAPLSDFRSDLPEGLDYVARRMLKKNPDARYATGLDLAADLAVIFDDLDAVHDEDALKQKFETVKHLGFFRDFIDAEIWELIRASDWQSYQSGSTIIREGDSDSSFYVILSGVVDVQKNGKTIDSLQEADCFGEMGYLSQTKRSASVVAKTDVAMMKVNSNTIDRASTDAQLRFLKVFVRVLIERLSKTTSELFPPA